MTTLAPLLIEHEILGQSNLYQHLDFISDACQKFGVADYMNDIEAATRRVIEVCSTGENLVWFKNFVDLSKINYACMQRAIASREYDLEGYTVIPSIILRTLCGTSLSDRLWAGFRTRRARVRRYALSRVIDECTGQAAPASRS
ncbi:hypothetical protein PUR23_16240 [Methylorubrum populi]|uniref:hypothetical protein n=1 Tax=Methylorubrum populi TaxID=223967 RepID=UPI0031F9FFC3